MLKMQTPSVCLFIWPEVTFVLFQPKGCQQYVWNVIYLVHFWAISL